MSIIDLLQEEADNSVDKNQTVENDNIDIQDNTAETQEETQETPLQKETDNPNENPKPVITKHFASEKVAKYNAFVEKTGKEDYKDFEFWQIPTNEVNEEELIRRYFSEKEGMSEKEISFEFKRMEVPNRDDDDFDDEFGENEDYSEQEILRERTLKKAKAWHEEELGKISSDNEDYSVPKKMSAEEFEQMVKEHQMTVYKSNLEGIYETLPNITGLALQTAGNEKQNIPSVDVIFTPDDVFKSDMRKVSEDIGIAINEFYGEGGKLTNPKGWTETAIWAYKPTRDKMIQFMVEQAVLKDRAERSSSRRNVTPDNYQPVSQSNSGNEEAFDEWRRNRF